MCQLFLRGDCRAGAIKGGSRIPLQGAPTYNCAKISEKLHEIENILDRL